MFFFSIPFLDFTIVQGILDKILPLLNVDETRHLALRSLSTITHHGGSSIRCEIAKCATTLTELMRAFPDDEQVSELGVITLAHSVCTAVEGDSKPSNPQVLQSLDMVDILKTVLETIKRPHRRPRAMVEHALELLTRSALHASSAYKAYPSAIRFLVAGLRSEDWATRCSCLGGLIRLYYLEAEDDLRQFDPRLLFAAIESGLPPHLIDIIGEYGQTKTELYLTLSCTSRFQKAMFACVQTYDLYALGLEQASLILSTEFSIPDGYFEVEDPKAGRHVSGDLGLPFTMWSDSLPHAARAIRAKKNPKEEDLADILDIKYFIMKQRVPDAVALAKKGIQRNPDQAYFYYTITLSADNVSGLRAAKKGLKCKAITPFVKYQMMQRAVEHAGDMGLKLLQDLPDAGEKKWEEGIAFLMSALEDAKKYVDEAPPDNRHMKNVGYWYILLTMLTKERLSPDLRELDVSLSHDLWAILILRCVKDNLKKLKIADEFSKYFGGRPPNTNLRLAQQAVVKHYSQAMKEFSRVFEELDNIKTKDAPAVDHEKLEDDLETWLEDMRLEDGTLEQKLRCGASENVRKVNIENVELYRCSWCGNPSAALKKCQSPLFFTFCV